MEFLQTFQLDIMLFLSGCCGILAIMTLMPKFMSRKRRSILVLMEVSSMLLLLFDRLAYLYRGNPSNLGGFMVRLSNGMCYFISLLIPLLVTYFLRDIYKNEGGMDKLPRRLVICDILFVIGTALIVISQFTGLYYTFDAQNNYQRAPGSVISYIIPLIVVIVQESAIIQYRKKLRPALVIALILSLIMPTFASIAQYFLYGLSLISITTVVVVVVFFIYMLCTLGEEVGKAKNHEIEFYKEAQKRETALFEETIEALANAIDAKDKYTHGHSTRVASISKKIAKEAGLSDEECKQVYYSALLHDVGKIGVRDDIINKQGKLTEEEYEEIKLHPVYGNQILSSIKDSPYLSTGAHYHHERYDGQGYPGNLSGDEIPTIARIIAVADAYDAMTSTRSYRDALSKEEVRNELEGGMGKQFDERFAKIMLKLMEKDSINNANG